MKYPLRTIKWRFQETHEPIPELANKSSLRVLSPQDLFLNYKTLFKDHVRERFVVFWLDASNKVMGFEIISEGTLNSSVVHPREVFRGAIVTTAASIILAHNHPSGNNEPSTEDVDINK